MAGFEDVDHKLAECAFFLDRLDKAGTNVFEFECYLAAFNSAARTVTLALQTALASAPEFAPWWDNQRELLREDPACRWFLETRNSNVHTGRRLVRGGRMYRDTAGELHFQQFAEPTEDGEGFLETDILAACKRHHAVLEDLVRAAFDRFPRWTDPSWIFDSAHLREAGLAVEDLEEELGYPRGWTSGIPLEERLRLLAES